MWKSRVIWLGLFILSLVGISYFGGAVSFGIFYAVLLVPVFSLLYILTVYFSFRIYQKIEGNSLVAKEPVNYYFTLQNEGFLSFAGIRVRFFKDFSGIQDMDDSVEYELFPGEGVKLSTGLVCNYRGEYEVGIERAEITDIFRLFKISYKNRETLRVTVKPRLVFLQELKCGDAEFASYRDSFINKNTPDVLSREYMAGDDIRKIRWKLYASTGKLLVRNDIGEEKQGVSVVLSTHRFCDEPEVYLPVESRMLECALASILFYGAKNTPVTSVFYNGSMKKSSIGSLTGFDGVYEKFCNVSFEENYRDEDMLDELLRDRTIFESRAVFFVVNSLSVKIYSACEVLNSNNVAVIIYKIGEENDFEGDFSKLSGTGLYIVPTDGELEEVM